VFFVPFVVNIILFCEFIPNAVINGVPKTMSDYAKAKVMRLADLPSKCPPKHSHTDAFTMIGEDTGATRFVLFNVEIRPGGEAELDTHPGCEHCYFVLSGVGDAVVDGEPFRLHPGDCLWIPPGSEHGIKPVGGQTLRFIVVTSPPPWVDQKPEGSISRSCACHADGVVTKDLQ
jgi:mannose-6-phosphate isomerase-like protein (cupin superfamily)